METREIYEGIIHRTIDQMSRATEAQGVRKDIFDAIRRRWVFSVEKSLHRPASDQAGLTSDPSVVVNRSKYLTHPALAKNTVQALVVKSEECIPEPIYDEKPAVPDPPAAIQDDDDEYCDEFGDAEVVHTTEVGRRLAAITPLSVPATTARTPEPVRKSVANRKAPPVDPIELTADLEDPEYDKILEPSDCECRIYGQTEICESVVGPRRSDSQWMITILNGFVQMGSEPELFFRTAKCTLPHLLQHQKDS